MNRPRLGAAAYLTGFTGALANAQLDGLTLLAVLLGCWGAYAATHRSPARSTR